MKPRNLLIFLALFSEIHAFFNVLSAINELAELGKKTFDFFDDNEVQRSLGYTLSPNATGVDKIKVLSHISESTIQSHGELRKLDKTLKEDLNATLVAIRNNIMLKNTIDRIMADRLKNHDFMNLFKDGVVEKLPVSVANQANKQLIEALYQNGKLTLQLANNMSGLPLGDGSATGSVIIDLTRAMSDKFETMAADWSEKLSTLFSGISANRVLIESFQGKVMSAMDTFSRELNSSETANKEFQQLLKKLLEPCFEITVQNIEKQVDANPRALKQLRDRVEPQLNSADLDKFSLTNYWAEESVSGGNMEMLTEIEHIFEAQLQKQLADHYFKGGELESTLKTSISVLQRNMENEFKGLSELIVSQNTDLKKFIETQAHLEHNRKFIDDVLIPLNLTMDLKLKLMRSPYKTYRTRFEELYMSKDIGSIPETMGHVFERNLQEVLDNEARRGDKFDFVAYEHFRELYKRVYQMAWDLRYFREGQKGEDPESFAAVVEDDKKIYRKNARDFINVDSKLRREVERLEFKHYVRGVLKNSIHDLSDELTESEFEMIFSYFYQEVYKHTWRDSGKTLNRYFLLYLNSSSECTKHSYTEINPYHDHMIKENSTEGARFLLFREHYPISKGYWQALLTDLYQSFSDLDPFSGNKPLSKSDYIENLRQVAHNAAIKICQEKVQGRSRCRFVLTIRDRCVYPRESNETFLSIVGPHKSIKIIIGL